MERVDDQNAGWRQTFALVALGAAIFSVLWFAIAALGTKFGLWGWQFGLGKMTVGWGPIVGIGSVGLAAIAMIVSLIKAPRKRPFILSLGALLIAGGMMGRLLAMGAQAAALPPIHDIQTNWENPIMFSDALMQVRTADGALNPVEANPVIKLDEASKERWPGFDGRRVAEAQESMEQDPEKAGEDDKEKLYPPLATLVIDKPKSEVLAAVKSLVESRGWVIVTEETGEGDETGVLEATHTSGWFGFKDDVAIHVLNGPGGTSLVDMRSVSRVGLSDLGANAKRVGNFMRDLRRVTSG